LTEQRDRILSAARALLAEGGPGAISFDKLAARLGMTKQAVLYWFPSKRDLLAGLFLPWLEAEAQALEAAVEGVTDEDAAVTAYLRALVGFHLRDLDRFRAMYLIPQTLGKGSARDLAPDERIYAITDRIYGVLAGRLEGPAGEARREAVAIHAAGLGLVTMLALGEGLGDPMKHGAEALTEALIARLTKGEGRA
jgi:AcrR family transcriptional regulator